MKVFITGDSHTGALARGLRSLQEQGRVASFKVAPLSAGLLMNERFFEERDGFVEITISDKIRSVSRLPVDPSEGVFDWYGLSAPLHVQPIVLDRFFYGKVPQPFTPALLKRLVLDRKRHSIDLMMALRRLGVRVFAIEAPRTFPYHPKLPNDLARVGEMETRCRDVVFEELARLDIPVVRLPARALRADGLMSEEFRHERPTDRHHGSAAFGAMMIEEMEKVLPAVGGS